MQLYSKVVGDNVDIVIPPNRTDIIHACDILEDIAIGYGFNTILSQCKPPLTLCRGVQQPLNKYR
jgi:phenylalanyl-tRNA synthetase beta chain